MRTSELNEWMGESDLGLEMVSYDEWRDRLLKMGKRTGIGDVRMLTDVLGPRALARRRRLPCYPSAIRLATCSGGPSLIPRQSPRSRHAIV